VSFGPTLEAELKAANVLGLQFSWDASGAVSFADEVTPEQRAKIVAVFAAHDPHTVSPLAYRAARAVAYRDELGVEQGDYTKALGDVIDVLIEQVETIRVQAAAPRTPAYETLVTRVAAIKQRIPKT
jgi:hypothetical protein